MKNGENKMSFTYDIALSYAKENENLVDKVYHYLLAEDIQVFFAPSPEGQIYLSGKNQREVFYNIFGLDAEYVALFISKEYVDKEVPMEEAAIAFAKHGCNGTVIPVYLDKTILPVSMFDPKSTNYFKSSSPAAIANHLATKIRQESSFQKEKTEIEKTSNKMIIKDNIANQQIFIQSFQSEKER